MAPSGVFCKPEKLAARPTSRRQHRRLSFAFFYQRKLPMRVGSARALLLTYPDRYTSSIILLASVSLVASVRLAGGRRFSAIVGLRSLFNGVWCSNTHKFAYTDSAVSLILRNCILRRRFNRGNVALNAGNPFAKLAVLHF